METVIKYLEIYSITAARYLLLTGLAFFVFYKLLKNKISNAKIQEKSAVRKDFLREIVQSLHANIILSFIGFIVLFTPLKNYTLVYEDIHYYPTWWLPLSLFLALIIHDTYFYWMHRLLHHKKIFKIAHLIHHNSTNPSPWAAYSFHFLEAVLEAMVIILIVFTIPMHFLSIFLFTIIGFLINIYGHLGYEIMPRGFRKSFLFTIFATSVFHNLHHLKFKGNYGLYFRIWDRIMKTENPEYEKQYDKIQQKRFGF